MRIHILILWGLSMSFTAKSQYYNYTPNTLNIPSLTERGDISAGIGWGRGEAVQALEIQGTYSPIAHVAVMANYFGAGVKAVRNNQELGTDYHFWEAGLGAYEALPKGTASLMVGYGNGNLYSNYQITTNDIFAKLKINRWFVQPGITYKSNLFQAGLALRLTRLSYIGKSISYSIEPFSLEFLQNLEKDSPLFLPEIGVQTGIRFKPVLVSLSISSIFPNTNEYDFARLNANLSMTLQLGLKHTKEKS